MLDAQRIPEGVDRIYLRAAPFVLGDRLGALDVFVEADDRALVSRAFVRVVRVPRSSHTRTGRTDESGHAQWIGLSPGKYQVDVTRDGLVARRALVDVPPGRPPAVVRLRMDTGMTITGRVSGIRLPTHGTRVLCRPLDRASGLAGDAGLCALPAGMRAAGGPVRTPSRESRRDRDVQACRGGREIGFGPRRRPRSRLRSRASARHPSSPRASARVDDVDPTIIPASWPRRRHR